MDGNKNNNHDDNDEPMSIEYNESSYKEMEKEVRDKLLMSGVTQDMIEAALRQDIDYQAIIRQYESEQKITKEQSSQNSDAPDQRSQADAAKRVVAEPEEPEESAF